MNRAFGRLGNGPVKLSVKRERTWPARFATRYRALSGRMLILGGAVLALANLLSAQQEMDSRIAFQSEREIFTGGCITCHGVDGKGTPKTTLGFEPPPTFPDFTNCVATARESDDFWRPIISHGGRARGFSEIMPSFVELLTSEQIEAVIRYLRSFCRESAWPRGELNLPRALVAEKAFLEDEAVITTAINAKGDSGTDHKITYEKRFGARNQAEVSLPFSFHPVNGGSWRGGVGDLVFGYKRLVLANLKTGSILSFQGEAILPTGNRANGFGKGVAVFETFGSYGQLLPGESFFQFQSGIELPKDTGIANRAIYWRSMFGKSIYLEKGIGRMWSPMVEFLADRELGDGEKISWDIVPQFQVTLNRRQHLRANFGIKIPLSDFSDRPVQVMFYVLWDWFDGGLRDGWK
jgi:mono/diheme cytochrome c family protein